LFLDPRKRARTNLKKHSQDCCNKDNTPRFYARAPLAKTLVVSTPRFSGGDVEEATPDPIPNSEVKLFGADGTAGEALWESRTPPGLF
jgi:hypothetical protein